MPRQRHINPTSAPANTEAVREARAIYHRVLTGWAHDVLTLRRDGLDRPSLRGWGDTLPVTPGRKAA
ncbi:MAG: hypothetical protein H6814_00235 [Phycisphaeraceae bacterium]|nr:hypothetical protein [Phycisphaeraceae bacterium]